jgi:hypothetical protein
MIGELIQTAHTYDEGRIAINYAFSGESSFNVFSAATIYSASTNLYDIFELKNSEDATRIQPGINIFTGGTDNFPTVNLTAATIDNLTVSGASSLGTVSATTMISGSTNLYSIFALAGSDTNDITRVQPGTNIFTGGTDNYPTVNLTAATLNNLTVSGASSLGTVSATTIISGSTNLCDIFVINVNNKSFLTLTDDTAIFWDYLLGYSAEVTLGGNRTLGIANVSNGDYGTLKVIQDGVGNRTLTLSGSNLVINGGEGSMLLTSNPNAIDILSFVYDGTNFLWNAGYNYT